MFSTIHSNENTTLNNSIPPPLAHTNPTHATTKGMVFNSQGFHPNQIQHIQQLMTANNLTWSVILETWYQDYPTLQNHDWTHASPPAQTTSTQSRGQHGWALMVQPHLKRHVQILQIHRLFVTFRIKQQNITCIYIPYSMNDRDLQEVLNNIKYKSDIFAGDFNTRLGSTTNDTTTTFV